jgi:HSP20 family protein
MTIVKMRRPLPSRVFSSNLFDEFDRLFEDGSTPFASRAENVGYPADLYETDDRIVLELVVPGLKAEDIDVSIEGRQLSIRATFPELDDTEGRRYWLHSIPRGAMNRNVKLPTGVDIDAIEAQVTDGLLVLSMPKLAEAKVKKIEITSG